MAPLLFLMLSVCVPGQMGGSLHALHHTFISINKADLPLKLMKSVIGHSSSMDTYGIYSHEIDSERHHSAQIIDNVFNGKLDEE